MIAMQDTWGIRFPHLAIRSVHMVPQKAVTTMCDGELLWTLSQRGRGSEVKIT